MDFQQQFNQQMAELEKLRQEVASKQAALRNEGLAQVQRLIDSLNLRADELTFPEDNNNAETPSRRGPRGKVAPKYIGPNGELWTGRGRPPHWMTDLLAAGHTKEEFLI